MVCILRIGSLCTGRVDYQCGQWRLFLLASVCPCAPLEFLPFRLPSPYLPSVFLRVSLGGSTSSIHSMLELKMWRKSAMSRIEFHQGQKRKLSKVFFLCRVRVWRFFCSHVPVLVHVCARV